MPFDGLVLVGHLGVDASFEGHGAFGGVGQLEAGDGGVIDVGVVDVVDDDVVVDEVGPTFPLEI